MVARGRLPHEFHPEAEEELLAAGQWYVIRNESAAIKLYEAVRHGVNQICDAPDRWPEYLCSTRKYLLRKLPYIIVYRALTDRVQIVAIAHTRRKPGYWRDRMLQDE